MAATATATRPKMYEGMIKVLSEDGVTVLSFTQGKDCNVYGMKTKDARRVANQILSSIERGEAKALKSPSKAAAPRAATNASKGAKKGAKKSGAKC
jgi:TATA-box binding protein (TBP) (component of TFIID and TFIIIB)